MTLHDKLKSLGWTTKPSPTPFKKLIYDADGKFLGDCSAGQCWALIKEHDK